MVEARFQDLVGEILEREKLAYRESVVDAGFQDACLNLMASAAHLDR